MGANLDTFTEDNGVYVKGASVDLNGYYYRRAASVKHRARLRSTMPSTACCPCYQLVRDQRQVVRGQRQVVRDKIYWIQCKWDSSTKSSRWQICDSANRVYYQNHANPGIHRPPTNGWTAVGNGNT